MYFKVTAAGAVGLTYSQTRRKIFESPTTSVRLSVGSPWLDRVRAVALVLPPEAVFSHTTALRIMGIDFAADEQKMHVTVPGQTQRGSRGAVIWHASPDASTWSIRGITITTPYRTWVDLGGQLKLEPLAAITDVLLRRGYLTREQLVAPTGCRGARNLRRAAELADPRSASIRESELRVHMVTEGFPIPDVNAAIIVDGEWVAEGDLVWREFMTIVEYDGDHHLTEEQHHQDEITRKRLRELGWTVEVLTNKHYKRLRTTLAEVKEVLITNGWVP